MARIEREIDLKHPIAKVWQALSSSQEFGKWFGVKLNGEFKVGQEISGKITHPGFEHVTWKAVIRALEGEKKFSFTWHPYAVNPEIDYSSETPTLVEFAISKSTNGTHLKITETGFEKIPEKRRDEAYKMHEQGWTQQMINIAKHLNGKG